MKLFNLEEAKKGHKVCTRSGLPARIICFDAKNEDYPIVALVDSGNGEELNNYTLEGRCFASNEIHDNDLFLTVEKYEGWINIYRRNNVLEPGMLYATEKDAKEFADIDCIATVKIEWED